MRKLAGVAVDNRCMGSARNLWATGGVGLGMIGTSPANSTAGMIRGEDVMYTPIGHLLTGLIFCFLSVLIAADTRAAENLVSSDAFNTDGPWAFRNSPSGEGKKAVYVAMTQSRESTGVWLGFTCREDNRLFASILDQSDFAAAVGDDVSVEILLDYSSVSWNATAKKTSKAILTFNPKLSNDLFTYAIHAQALAATFLNSELVMQTYNFQLQPNSMAFRGIIDTCIPQHLERSL